MRVACTVLDMDDMQDLIQRAKTFVANVRTSACITPKCTWFYRNKSRQYFDKITSEHGGVMKAYLKDAGGDQRSPINGEINGLFFMTAVENGEPLSFSPFGDTRVLIRAEVLLSLLLASNVYFADFFGMYRYSTRRPWHYITLVLARPGSDADKLCQQRLPKLDINDKSSSPFLFIEKEEVHVMYIDGHIMVELFFTEDLKVDQLLQEDDVKAKMDYVTVLYRGRPTQGGRAKHSQCAICEIKSITPSE